MSLHGAALEAGITLLATCALVTWSARRAEAAGYAINDQGARAMGQGLVVTALLDGPETVFYNPGSVARAVGRRGTLFAVGSTVLLADFASQPEETGSASFDSSRNRFIVPHAAVVQGLSKSWALGASVNAPFGLATEWPADYPGRFVSRVADLETLQLGVMAAVRLPRGWSVGFGPTWTHADVQLVRDVDLSIFRTGHQAEADLTGSGSALGLRVGARWQGESGWAFGLAAHGPTRLRFDGKVDYSVEPLGAFSLDQAIMTLFQDGPAGTTLTLPMTVTAGLAHHGQRWSLGLDVTWTDWSVMDSVIVDLEPIEAGGLSLVIEEFVVNEWHDAFAVRLGARRRVSERWSWSAGVYHDRSPVPLRTADPLLPDSNRTSATAGLTYSRKRFTLDAAAQYVHFEELDTRGTGNRFLSAYDASVLALAVTAGWRWGAK